MPPDPAATPAATRRWPPVGRWFLGLGLFSSFALLAVYLLLPVVLETAGPRFCRRLLPAATLHYRVDRVGIFETALRQVAFSLPGLQVHLPLVVVHYTPAGLAAGRVVEVVVSGGAIRLEPGATTTAPAAGGSGPPQQVPVDRLVLDDVAIDLSLPQGELTLRGRLSLDQGHGRVTLAAEGLDLTLAGTLPGGNATVLPFTVAGSVDLDRLPTWLVERLPEGLHGSLTLRGHGSWDLATGGFPRGRLTVDGTALRYHGPPVTVAGGGQLHLAAEGDTVTVAWRDLQVAHPLAFRLAVADGQVQPAAGSGWRIRLPLTIAGEDEGWAVQAGLLATGTVDPDHRHLALTVTGEELAEVTATLAGGRLHLEPREMRCALERQQATASGECRLHLATVDLAAAGVHTTAHHVRLTVAGRRETGKDLSWQADLAGDWRLAAQGAGGITAQGRLALHGSGDHRAGRWRLQVSDGRLAAGDLRAGNLAATMTAVTGGLPPWTGGPAVQGEVQVDDLRWRTTALGAVTGTVRGPGANRRWEFSLQAQGVPLAGEVRAAAHLADGKLAGTVTIPEHFLVDAPLTDMGLTGGLLSGRLAGQGTFLLAGGGEPQWEMHLTLAEGELRRGPLRLFGIDTAADLHGRGGAVASRPTSLRFGGLEAGEYRAGAGEIAFQLLPAGQLLVERGRLAWAGGQVRVGALRLEPGQKEYRLELVGDRLNLAAVLGQFGIDNVSGQGTVNGRVPVTVTGGRVVFDDGFLYSTPGTGGVIRLAAGRYLEGAGTGGAVQLMQLDFAQAALQAFQYDWARIHLTSEGEDVLLALNLFGRPEKPLPFAYDRTLGVFKRMTVAGGGLMRDIRLDINFRVPFNDLLGYGTTIRNVLELGQ